jgi:RHH-type rel operon transcriptional repressor/antitoxin RelB
MSISLRLEKNLEERINNLANKTHRTKSFYIREMILRAIEDIEDYYLAENCLEAVHKNEEIIYSHADVRKELGLDN